MIQVLNMKNPPFQLQNSVRSVVAYSLMDCRAMLSRFGSNDDLTMCFPSNVCTKISMNS